MDSTCWLPSRGPECTPLAATLDAQRTAAACARPSSGISGIRPRGSRVGGTCASRSARPIASSSGRSYLSSRGRHGRMAGTRSRQCAEADSLHRALQLRSCLGRLLDRRLSCSLALICRPTPTGRFNVKTARALSRIRELSQLSVTPQNQTSVLGEGSREQARSSPVSRTGSRSKTDVAPPSGLGTALARIFR